MERLAIRGGQPVRAQGAWPVWPQFDEGTRAALLDAVESSRWTVSWPSRLGRPALERTFAEQFARYHGVPHCVAVDHGSSALVVALEALDIGPGDEVVVPAVTWVATASAVLRVGALPVIADVDPETGCLSPDTVRAALSPRTRAVIAVHLACTVADIDGLLQLTEARGIGLIEDCAQAHGALWRGRPVGTFGALGTFSFQQGKVLSGGEGGAVITSDEKLYRRAQELRADSRTYAPVHVAPGEMEIVQSGTVIGANYCLSDLHSAILIDQLPRLDAQHEHRAAMAERLLASLAKLGDFTGIPVPPECDRRSVYKFGVRFRPGTFGSASVAEVAQALSAELDRAVYPADDPLYRNVLFRPETKARFSGIWTESGRRQAVERPYPGAETYHATTLLFHHSALLADQGAMDDIAEAFAKVQRLTDQLETVSG
ncbi:DegT/DnrJ/EryC1/StrS family aminotransferase [Streptomyces capitiformicae]|uniref:Aminotransferase DegT n=1 Tax=Streptomyces capitiformicae TaxID=2014920 RepID=A0A919GHX7_9ACTN|nr:DegT/DnrJ/EryC1/StrS family aminotransferase [Streptomyces capitiformicae]GHH84737.1 aminotransferase DegT [Streptomyces capitiformicae]